MILITLLPVGMWSIAIGVSVPSVCRSLSISQKPHVQISQNFLCMLPVTGCGVIFFDNSTIHFVLVVLCIMSHYDIVARRRRCESSICTKWFMIFTTPTKGQSRRRSDCETLSGWGRRSHPPSSFLLMTSSTLCTLPVSVLDCSCSRPERYSRR